MRGQRVARFGVLLCVFGSFSGVARAQVPTPAANIKLPDQASTACGDSAGSSACQDAMVDALNGARAVMGLKPYTLPAGFAALAPEQQLLVLANLDRIAYGIAPVLGLNSTLNADAAAGARAHEHPAPSLPASGFTASWASGYPTALQAYYSWFYADGPGSGNVGCQAPGDAGCWGHRGDILWDGGADLLMGAAAIADTNDYGLLLVRPLVGSGATADVYRWQDAVTAGAGAGAGAAPGAPTEGGAATGTDTTTTTAETTLPRVRFTIRYRGSRIEVSGRITPGLSGKPLTVQLRRGRATRRLKSLTTTGGKFRIRALPPRGRGRITAKIALGRSLAPHE